MLNSVKKHYTFTTIEKDACNSYLNIIYPLRYCILDNLIKHKEKGDFDYFNKGLIWIYNNLTRNDFRKHISI